MGGAALNRIRNRFKRQTLGETLKAARTLCCLTQGQLASRAGATAGYLAYLEKDQRQPSLGLLSRLVQALKLEPAKLFVLAHPEARALLRAKPVRGPTRDQAWRQFVNNEALLARYQVRLRELEVLAQTTRLGQVIAPYDFLFILNSIRQAMDTEEYP